MIKTARLSSNTPLEVEDKPLMDAGIADKVKLLCHVRKTPNVLYGMFVELTRQFYSDKNNLPVDVQTVWAPEMEKSQLWIDSDYIWEDINPEQRPAIYIKLGEINYSSSHGRHDGRIGIDLEEAEYHYARKGAGNISWAHIGSTSGETIVLAGATLDYFDAVSKLIQEDFNFQTFEIVQISPLSMTKETKERYLSTVTAAFTFEDTWTIKKENPKLKKIIFAAGQKVLDAL